MIGSERALEPLREAIRKLDGSARIQAARALVLLADDSEGRQALQEMSKGEHAAEARAALADLDSA